MDGDADEPFSPTIPFYDKKTREIPCYRESIIYGAGSGLGAGLLYFLATSKIRRSTDIALASFTFVTLGYWFNCRYQWSHQRFYSRQLKADLEDYMYKEGTSQEKPVDV